jgi:hypothetical protein
MSASASKPCLPGRCDVTPGGSPVGEVAYPRLWLGLILVAFVVLRLPTALKQPGGQDEEFFAVPGYTVVHEGIPRIPYFPVRNPDAFFHRADELLFALPPGLFYLQAPFFLLFPPGYPTARLTCIVAGLLAIVLVNALARKGGGTHAGLCAAGMYAASRVLFFPATFARPDLWCAVFGLAAFLFVWKHSETGRPRDAAFAGLLLGAGLLCHPFAAVYCLISGLWVLLAPGPPRRRLLSAAVMTIVTLGVFSLWLPLVLKHPEAFRHQFANNVLGQAGPGIGQRLLWPWPYFPHQATLLLQQAGPWQTALMTMGLLHGTLIAVRANDRGKRVLAMVCWSTLLLMTALQGTHPTKGYWCFTGALVFAATGVAIAPLLTGLRRKSLTLAAVASLLLFALFLPQSGLRLWWNQVRPSIDDRYDGPRFAKRVISELPETGRYLVEPAFVFDFWLAGRDVQLRTSPNDYGGKAQAFDWLVVSRDGLDKRIPETLNARFVKAFGDKDDPLACYAEIYRH